MLGLTCLGVCLKTNMKDLFLLNFQSTNRRRYVRDDANGVA